MGIQSFNDDKLQRLGRIHNAAEAKSAVSLAKVSGLKSFNLDLMHGLPNQTLEEALDDLRQAIELAPPHLSWYQLTIEPIPCLLTVRLHCRMMMRCGISLSKAINF